MYSRLIIILVFLSLLLVAGCHKEDLSSNSLLARTIANSGHTEASLTMPESNDYASIPQDPFNVITAEKVLLGQLIFHDPGFGANPKKRSAKGTYSCASCHLAKADFRAGLPQGIGEGGLGIGLVGEGRFKNESYTISDLDVQNRTTITALNVAYMINVLWDGRLGSKGANANTTHLWTGAPQDENAAGFLGPETQAIAGLKVHRMAVSEALVDELGYRALFDQAFPLVQERDRYSLTNAALAIAAYERTLLANQSPFQEWLKGNHFAMTEQEKAGATIFFGKAGCVSCHYGPALADNQFHALGTTDLSEHPSTRIFLTPAAQMPDLGRGAFTGRPEDFYRFRTPTIYNTGTTQFHGAMSSSVRETVEYFNSAVPANSNIPNTQISPLFRPLELTNGEVDNLVAFLENALRDPDLERYAPVQIPDGGCFPNRDEVSEVHLGCN